MHLFFSFLERGESKRLVVEIKFQTEREKPPILHILLCQNHQKGLEHLPFLDSEGQDVRENLDLVPQQLDLLGGASSPHDLFLDNIVVWFNHNVAW